MDQTFKEFEVIIHNFANAIEFRKKENSLNRQLAESKFKTELEVIKHFEKYYEEVNKKFELLLDKFEDLKNTKMSDSSNNTSRSFQED